MNEPETLSAEQSGGSAGAHGSAIHGATYHELDEANAGLCAENAQLQEVVKAAWRLRFYGYHDWAIAGGVDNCPHGIGSGIHCARCDELLLRKTYEQMTSPNAPHEPPPTGDSREPKTL